MQEYLCRSYLALGDSSSWLGGLKTGVEAYPNYPYFFTSIQEYLDSKGRYDEALALADSMIQYNSKNPLFWYAKALAQMRKDDYDNCVYSCNKVLALDSTNIEACYLKGLSYCNMAKKESDEMKKVQLWSTDYQRHRKAMVSQYVKAEEPLERMRALAPNDASRWAPLLYLVYLNQNKGTEFGEVDRVMQNLNAKGAK